MSTAGLRGRLRAGWARGRLGRLPDSHVVAAALHGACGALVLAVLPVLPGSTDRAGVAAVAVAAIALGVTIALLPWGCWDAGAVRWLVPEALALVAVFNVVARDLSLHALFYFVVWVWVGLTQPPGTSTRFGPLLAVAYVVPALGSADGRAIVTSSVLVVPVCVVVGEVVALVAERLRRSERAVARSEARYASLLRHASEFIVVFGPDHRVRFANAAFERLVGASTEALRELHAPSLLHPDERDDAVRWFLSAAGASGSSEVRRVRLRNAAGDWRLLEVSLTDLLGDESVGGLLLSGRDVTDRDATESVLRTAAYTDALTDLGNRAALERDVAALPVGSPVTLLFFDVDGFKVVNDSLGHTAGDRLLVQIASRLRERLDLGALCRTGGDEFVLVLASPAPGDGARAAALVLDALAEPFDLDGRRVRVGVSIGVAEGDSTATAEELLRRADLAMYRAKRQGGARWSFFDDELAARAEQRMQIESDLRAALDRDELFLEFQPVVDLATGRTVKVEALVRWSHPALGRLPPDAFIPVAEESGLMGELGAWVLEGSLAACARWRRAGHRLDVAVNVSPRQLDVGFVATVAGALERHGLPGSDLWLEITEHSLLDVDDAEVVLAALRELDVSLAIDDFGTGYSSLSYLHRLDVDALKVDRSFLAADGATERRGLVAAIVDMAHHLDLLVVAEGVESVAQLELLRSLGCDFAQGYHLARPMPSADLLARLFDEEALARSAHALATEGVLHVAG